MNEKKRLSIFYYAFHSKPQATDKLHIIVRSYNRNPRGPVTPQPDPSVDDYGLIVESECGHKGVLLKPDRDAYNEGDFEGMGLKHFRDKFSDIDAVYFFMPPVLLVSMPVAITQGMIPEKKVCEICKDNLQANLGEAARALQEEKGGATEGQQKDKEEKENGTVSKGKKQYPRKIVHVIPLNH